MTARYEAYTDPPCGPEFAALFIDGPIDVTPQMRGWFSVEAPEGWSSARVLECLEPAAGDLGSRITHVLPITSPRPALWDWPGRMAS